MLALLLKLFWCRCYQLSRPTSFLSCRRWLGEYLTKTFRLNSHTVFHPDNVDSVSRTNTFFPREFDVIGIDEGQFFPDIVNWCEEMANRCIFWS